MVEVLSLVRFESGRLLIHSKNGPASLFIENYHVLCAYQGVEPVSPKWLVPLLAGLAREREAEFQFDEGIWLMEPWEGKKQTTKKKPKKKKKKK
ncbi:hypothetical protein, partial [Oceanithermus sp.]